MDACLICVWGILNLNLKRIVGSTALNSSEWSTFSDVHRNFMAFVQTLQRPAFPQRFAQTMAQLDMAAAAVTRNYPDGDALRAQFTRGYADLRGKYDNALRSIGDDVTAARRNDYFVIHSDAIAQSAQSLN